MRMADKNSGISSLFDAILFFVIMVILSGTVLYFSSMSAHSSEAYTRDIMTNYAEESSLALMDSTIPDVQYLDYKNEVIDIGQGNTQIKYLILLELQLLDNGLDQSNIIYENNLKVQARTFISMQYHFSFKASYHNASSGESYEIIISDGATTSDSIPRYETVAHSWEEPMLDPAQYGRAKMEFIIWRAE